MTCSHFEAKQGHVHVWVMSFVLSHFFSVKKNLFLEESESYRCYVHVWRNGQIRSHAQKYFLKVQKSGANEHLPPPRPKRKARHPYPQKAPKNGDLLLSSPCVPLFDCFCPSLWWFYYAAVSLPSHAVGSIPASNAPLLQPAYLYSFSDSQSLLGNPASSSSSLNHESTNLPIPAIQGIWFLILVCCIYEWCGV